MSKAGFSALMALALSFFSACGAEKKEAAPSEPALPDGVYSALFRTDSSMFHVNEVCEGRGILTVENGRMSIHVVMPSKNVVNLFAGTAEDAQKKGASLLTPSIETVKYSDGTGEEVHAFDIPVPCLDKEFDCALVGTKGKWYDHKVSVSDPVMREETAAARLEDGEYEMAVSLEGGSGKASVASPAKVIIRDGSAAATVVWSSSNYESMTVGGVKYEPVSLEGGSAFNIPAELDADMNISAVTSAMSKPHEIEYVLRFDSSTAEKIK